MEPLNLPVFPEDDEELIMLAATDDATTDHEWMLAEWLDSALDAHVEEHRIRAGLEAPVTDPDIIADRLRSRERAEDKLREICANPDATPLEVELIERVVESVDALYALRAEREAAA
jgi:hypothetical protein